MEVGDARDSVLESVRSSGPIDSRPDVTVSRGTRRSSMSVVEAAVSSRRARSPPDRTWSTIFLHGLDRRLTWPSGRGSRPGSPWPPEVEGRRARARGLAGGRHSRFYGTGQPQRGPVDTAVRCRPTRAALASIATRLEELTWTGGRDGRRALDQPRGRGFGGAVRGGTGPAGGVSAPRGGRSDTSRLTGPSSEPPTRRRPQTGADGATLGGGSRMSPLPGGGNLVGEG